MEKQRKIEELDGNFRIPDASPAGTVYRSAEDAPFTIHGLLPREEGKPFRRIPAAVTEEMSPGARVLATNTTGARVRFRTDSPYVAVRAGEPCPCVAPHMACAATMGFDLYADGKHVRALFPPVGYERFMPVFRVGEKMEQWSALPGEGMHDVTLFLPTYSDVTSLEIGLAPGAAVCAPAPYRYSTPVVFYGSSITHGAAASRPGNTYPAMLSRWLDTDIVNLGLSGHALGEEALAHYIATLEMSTFVYGYDHNAPSLDHLRKTHEPFFRIIRAARPELPIVVCSRPGDTAPRAEVEARRAVIRATVEHAVANGDRNVYFLDGGTCYDGLDPESCVVDGVHPGDLGFFGMARTVAPILRGILEK